MKKEMLNEINYDSLISNFVLQKVQNIICEILCFISLKNYRVQICIYSLGCTARKGNKITCVSTK